MDDIEKEIVNYFIKSNRRERIIFELSSKRKRGNCIEKLVLNFDDRCIIDVSDSVDSYKVILKIFESYGAKNQDDYYLLSLSETGFMSLERVLAENVFK